MPYLKTADTMRSGAGKAVVPAPAFDEEQARRLVARPELLDSRDSFGRTALHRAAHRGKATVCRILLDGGANALAKDAAGLDAVALARLAGHRSLAKEIADHLEQQTALAARALPPLTPAEIARLLNSTMQAVTALIAAGRLDAVDAKGDTLLHICARSGALLACQKLFEAGIAVDRPNHQGETAADAAEAKGHEVLAQMLRGKSLRFDRPVLKSDATFEIDGEFEFDYGDASYEDAEEFHSDKGFSEAQTSVDWITGKVIVVGEDGHTATMPDFSDWGSVEIVADDFVVPVQQVAFEAAPRSDVAETAPEDFRQARTRGRKSRRQARPSELGSISLSEADARAWLEEIVAAGWADPSRITDLIDLCTGGHDDDLAANVSHFLQDCGFETSEEGAAYDAVAELDLDEMTGGLMALCNSTPVLAGRGRFNLPADEERRLLEDIRRTSAQAEMAVAADDVSRSAIISLVQGLLAGAFQPHEVTRVEFRESDPEATERYREALTDLEILHDDILAGVVPEDGMIDHMAKAIHEFGLLPEIFEGLAEAIASVDTVSARNVVRAVAAQRSAFHGFLERHLSWARLFAAREALEDEEVEEVFQIAWTGLRRALVRFDPDRGIRFMSYSAFWMRQSLIRERNDRGACVRIPVHRHQRHAVIDAAIDRLEARGVFPSDDLLARETGMSRETITAARRTLRFAEPFQEDAEADEKADIAFGRVLQSERARIVSEALSEFNERTVAIIRGRFGFDADEEFTLEELGQQFGVTRERIRQLEEKVLTRLAHPVRLGRIGRYL